MSANTLPISGQHHWAPRSSRATLGVQCSVRPHPLKTQREPPCGTHWAGGHELAGGAKVLPAMAS